MSLGVQGTATAIRRLWVGVLAGVLITGLAVGAGSGAAQAGTSTKATCADGGACKVGDTGPGGGVVFMLPSSGGNSTGKAFEAAPAGWSGPVKDPVLEWCDVTDTSVAGTRTGIGTGAANTRRIGAACASAAVHAVLRYAGGGKADWFLPSKDELNALYEQRAVVGGLAAGRYWSSSQAVAYVAWCQVFATGSPVRCDSAYPLRVRPIRAFSTVS